MGFDDRRQAFEAGLEGGGDVRRDLGEGGDGSDGLERCEGVGPELGERAGLRIGRVDLVGDETLQLLEPFPRST